MGSLPEGTMCVYCNEEEASYIPDGMLGCTCMTCVDDALAHGEQFLDRKRMDRYLKSLRAVTANRTAPFYKMFLESELGNGHGYDLAPFLIWTSQWHRPLSPRAAVAATDDDATVQESDDDANSLLWEDRWDAVMAAELARETDVAWTLDRTLPQWHESAYLGLRTPHGRTLLVSATQEIMCARHETLQAEEAMRRAVEDLRIARSEALAANRLRWTRESEALDAQTRYAQAVAHERTYDSGVWGGEQFWEPQWRHRERYEPAWAILAWMTAHGPIGNVPAQNELAQYYHDQLSHWDRFRNGLFPGGPHWSEDEADEDWANEVGPQNPTLMEHYLGPTRGHY